MMLARLDGDVRSKVCKGIFAVNASYVTESDAFAASMVSEKAAPDPSRVTGESLVYQASKVTAVRIVLRASQCSRV